MAQLNGLQFLKVNQIENKKCNMEKPFAFISYAHDPADSHIVRNVFNSLYEKGYNLWIDTANIPKNENSWERAAQIALIKPNCKLAFFFRSEESLIRKPIKDELQMIKFRGNISRIVTIDIWHDENNTATDFLTCMMSTITEEEDIDKLAIAKDICSYVSVDNSAYRIRDVNANLDELVAELAKELESEGICSSNPTELEPQSEPQPEPKLEPEVKPEPKPEPEPQPEYDTNNYVYKIFGKEYRSGEKGQAELMYNTFSAIFDKYPDKIDDIIKICTSVEYAENVSNTNTSKALPTYFRRSRNFIVNGRTVVVGSSYGFDQKISQISKMLKACGESSEQFEIISMPEIKQRSHTEK